MTGDEQEAVIDHKQVISDIMDDRSYLITYGYIGFCLLGIALGLVSVMIGELATGLLVMVVSVAGLEMWTHWGLMKWSEIKRGR